MAGEKRKIPLKRRETKEQRAVSFSKRRRGLLSKAAEYCMRTRSQIAMVVSSPVSDKTFFTFGHSSVDTVFDAFVNNRVPEASDNEKIVRSGILMFNEIKDMELDKENNKAKKRNYESEGFWEDYDKLGNFESNGELQFIVDKLVKLREKVIIRLNDLLSFQLSASGSASVSNVGYAYEQFNKFGSNAWHDDDKEFINFETGCSKQEVMNMAPSLCPLIWNGADTNIVRQNFFVSPSDQPNPFASVNEFWQLLPCDADFLKYG